MLDRLIRFVGFLFFGIAIWLIAKEIHLVGWHYLWQTLLATPGWLILTILAVVSLNYLILSGYDLLALRYINCKLPYPKVLEASSISFAFSNTTGHTYAAGGAVRYLFYRPQGISRLNILKMVIFDTLSVLIGLLASFETAVLLHSAGTRFFVAHQFEINNLAILTIILFLLYYTFIINRKQILKWRKLTLRAPTGKESVGQILVGLGDNITLFLCFYVILCFFVPTHFTSAFMIFMMAQTIGFATQVPGGLGVFEGTFLSLFPHTLAQKAGILAALVLFRVFYYFVPFILSGIYLGIRFVKRKIS